MVSARKIEANRANAQASTGPKTARGKARSARNALRHGLSLSVWADPNLAKEVRALALKLAANQSIEVLQDALLVAETQIELNRIRRARRNLLRQHRGGLNRASGEMVENSPISKSYQSIEKEGRFEKSSLSDNPPENAGRTARLPLDTAVLDQLIKIGRYERRSLSKRKFAIRKFDQARKLQSKAQKGQRQQTKGGAGRNSP